MVRQNRKSSLWLLAFVVGGYYLGKGNWGHARWRRASTSAKRLGKRQRRIERKCVPFGARPKAQPRRW